LCLLTAEDLEELGVAAVGHRRQLLAAIAKLNEQRTTETVTPAIEPANAASGPLREGAVSSAGERRQLTVMFCDLVGSMALSEKLDPEELSLLHA
jgi:class 3 adenylate cyclase